MEASKLQVNPNLLRFERMTPKKRTELRRKNVLSLIRSTPAGTPITLAEFRVVTQHKDESAVHALLRGMLKKGMIARTREGLRHYSYCVPGDTATHAPKIVTPDSSPLLDLVKEYAWESNDDSLRGFIKWMGGRNEANSNL